jgi:hypothetical protein
VGVEIPPGYGQATLVFYATGVAEFVNCTMGFKNNDTVERTADYMASVFRIEATKVGAMCEATKMSSQWTLAGADVSYNRGQDLEMGTSRASTVGTLAISPLPVNCAFLVRKNTVLGGRRHRGRWYLPPAWVDENLVGAGGAFTITSVYTDLQTRLTKYLADLDTALFPMYVLHGGPGDFVPPPTKVTSLSLQPVLATQRRRMR